MLPRRGVSTQERTVPQEEAGPTAVTGHQWNGLHRLGGASFVALGAISLGLIPAFAVVGPQPENPIDAYLVRFAANRLVNVVVIGIFSLITVLFIPAFLALYVALRDVERGYMLLAIVLFLLSVVFSFVTTIIPNLALFYISDGFAAATTDAQRSLYVAATVVVRAWQSAAFLFGLTYSVAIAIAGLVMLKGTFNRPTAYLGITGGIVGIIAAIPFLSPLFLLFFPLDAIWFLLVGFKLYRLTSPSASGVPARPRT